MPLILLFLIIMTCCIRGNSWADGLGGRILETYQQSDQDSGTTRFFDQKYELRYQRQVAEPLSYRFSLLGEDNRITSTFKQPGSDLATRQESRIRLVEPVLDIMGNFSPVFIQAGSDFREAENKADPGPDHNSRLLKLYSAFSIAPDDKRLPGLSANIVRRTNRDPGTTIDTEDTNIFATVTYSPTPPLALSTSAYSSEFVDKSLNFTRDNRGEQGNINYSDAYLSSRLTVVVNYFIDSGKLTEKTEGSGTVAAPFQYAPVQGLYSNDPTPLATQDNPLVSSPALIDRDLSSSAGIAIGSGGASFQNIGLDLGTSLPADQLRVHVRTAAGDLVSFAGPIIWSVYWSADGVDWVLITDNAGTTFNAFLGYYDITFPQTTARFFKTVNFGVNTAEAFVTELEIFRHTAFAEGQTKKTDFLNQNATLNLSAKPAEKLVLSYNGTLNTVSQESGGQSFASEDRSQLISAVLGPHGIVTATLQYQTRDTTQTSGLDQVSDEYGAILNFAFLRTAFSTFSATRTTVKINGEPAIATNAVALSNALDLYPKWHITLNLGYNWQRDYQHDQSLDSSVLSGTSIAQLTPSLDWVLSFSTQQGSSVAPGGTELVFQRPRDKRIDSTISYRPSQQLSLIASLGYHATNAQSGMVQGYRLTWLPFPGGAIQISTRYDRDRDEVSNQRSDRFTFNPRWNINPHAYLDFIYTHIAQRGITSTTIDTSLITLSILL